MYSAYKRKNSITTEFVVTFRDIPGMRSSRTIITGKVQMALWNKHVIPETFFGNQYGE